MPNPLLTALDRLGISKQPRYPMNTAAEILGVSRDQVADLLRLGRLQGTKSSERRWAGVWHDELETYMERIHEAPVVAPRVRTAPGTAIPKDPASGRIGVHPVSMRDQLVAAIDEDPETPKMQRADLSQATDIDLDC